MAKEQKLLKDLLDALNKPVQNEDNQQKQTSIDNKTNETSQFTLPLKSIDELLNEQTNTKQQK